MYYPRSIKRLVEEFTKLPTVGPKTAERYVFYLLKQSQADLDQLASSVKSLKSDIKICSSCGAVAEKQVCEICSDKSRDSSIVCVVANTRDMISIEDSGEYKGLYHILGGLIDQINDIGPEKLNIDKLIKKSTKDLAEIIIALNPTIEGETTAMHLQKRLQGQNIKITRIARGLPVGSDIEYADNMTISNALKYRNKL